MELNSKYPVKKIIKMYESGKSTKLIGEKLGYEAITIRRILRRNNIKLRNAGGVRMVRQIETGRLFSSVREAEHQTGINRSSISSNCNGKYKKAGGYHWEFVDNE